MNDRDKSDAELALDALHDAGAITDEQHRAAVERLRARIAELRAPLRDGSIAGT
jgi:hypothetical protein